MTREGALLVMVAVAAVLLALMAWAWRRRTRRDAQPLSTVTALPDGAHVTARFDGLYVATTRQGEPLERVAAPGLGFRSKAQITVADAGIALDIPGQDRIVLPAERIDEVAQATLAIDRVVEKDGLVRVTWRTDPGFAVDTYLRPQDASAKALAERIRPLIHRTGSAA
ncbi:hypothetical protein [Microbacterium luticocti]|uniref:PH-like domain-containing protein n=1 Tax=Microbacterium luticocti TaxID=451764 RepID=UPI000402605D|nr:hypothetical protein [Microbacterium luticocti]